MSQNIKEIFNNVMNFKSSRRTLKWELAYWGETVLKWYAQGLPKKKELPESLSVGDTVIGEAEPFSLTITKSGGRKDDYNVHKYFGLDEGFYPFPFLYWLYPSFEEKIVFEDDKYIEMYGATGIKTRELKDHSSMPLWLEFPLKSKQDWEEIKKERFNVNSVKERFLISKKEYFNDIKWKTLPSGIFDFPVGFFGSLRYLMGETKLFLLYYDDPGLIHDICSHLCDFWLNAAEELTAGGKVFDYACFWEDMSGRQGSLISPAAFKEFMSPYYKKIIKFLKSRKINLFIVDTDGKVDGLIPLFLDAGVNVLLPFERQAGNNLTDYRKRFPELRMIGGFDKNTLFKGKKYIDEEFNDISWLISKGGFIPHIDHAVPPNSSWENFKYYREKLNSIIDNTCVLD